MSANDQFILVLVVGSTGMLMLVVAIVLFVLFYQKRMLREEVKQQLMEVDYQKKMVMAALESQETERKRVSKDLHDDVGMMLMTVRTQVSAVEGKTLVPEIVADIRGVIDETHETVRRISWDLMPSTLERFGLELTIKEMCRRLTVRNAIPVEFTEIGKSTSLDKSQQTLLYRVIQESVSNCLRHAQARKVQIQFEWTAPHLDVQVADDGVGFDFPRQRNEIKARRGLGLINLENRITMLGAQLHYEKNEPTGTVLKLKIPLNHA